MFVGVLDTPLLCTEIFSKKLWIGRLVYCSVREPRDKMHLLGEKALKKAY